MTSARSSTDRKPGNGPPEDKSLTFYRTNQLPKTYSVEKSSDNGRNRIESCSATGTAIWTSLGIRRRKYTGESRTRYNINKNGTRHTQYGGNSWAEGRRLRSQPDTTQGHGKQPLTHPLFRIPLSVSRVLYLPAKNADFEFSQVFQVSHTTASLFVSVSFF